MRPLSGFLTLLPNTFTCISRLLGDADIFLGDYAQARADYDKAIEVCTKVGWRSEIAISRVGLAEALLRGYPEERATALEHLDFAIAEFEAMGMPRRWRRRCGFTPETKPLRGLLSRSRGAGIWTHTMTR